MADRGGSLSGGDCQQIVTPLYRGSNAKGKAGSGLGLTVVRRLVIAGGGNVKAEARQGGGLLVCKTWVQAPDRRSKPRTASLGLASAPEASPPNPHRSPGPLIPA